MSTAQLVASLAVLGFSTGLCIWAALTGDPARENGQHSQDLRDEPTRAIRMPERPAPVDPLAGLPRREDLPWNQT